MKNAHSLSFSPYLHIGKAFSRCQICAREMDIENRRTLSQPRTVDGLLHTAFLLLLGVAVVRIIIILSVRLCVRENAHTTRMCGTSSFLVCVIMRHDEWNRHTIQHLTAIRVFAMCCSTLYALASRFIFIIYSVGESSIYSILLLLLLLQCVCSAAIYRSFQSRARVSQARWPEQFIRAHICHHTHSAE